MFKNLVKKFKKEKPKEVSVADLVKSAQEILTPEQQRAKAIEDHIRFMAETAKKRYGYDDEHARKWAWEQVQKKMDKRREQGVWVPCQVCKKGGANAQSGPMVRTADGKGYRHQNCQEQNGQ